MKLTDEIKRMLNALAYANAGDYLTASQKDRVLAGAQPPVTTQTGVAPVTRPQVGLYLGSELPEEILQYVLQTCIRLRHGLTVLTFGSEAEASELLSPHRQLLESAGIEPRILTVRGEPPAALAHALRKHPEVAFLVCNEAGYFGHGLLSGTQRRDGLPVPVVLVAANDLAARTQQPAAGLRRVA